MAKGSEPNLTSRLDWHLLLGSVVLVAIIVAYLCFDPHLSTIGDNAEFAILAKAVSQGLGLRYLSHPELRPATKYPPGFPVLLAGWIKLFGDSVISMKIAVCLTFVGAVGVTWLIASKFLNLWLATIASLVIGTASIFVSYSHQILSDMPYTFFSLVAIYLVVTSDSSLPRLWIGLGLSIWAFLIRTVGGTLVLAFVIYLFLSKRRRASLLLLTVLVGVGLCWSLRNRLETGEASRYLKVLLAVNPYAPDLGQVGIVDLLSRIWVNLRGYIGGLITMTFLPSYFELAGGYQGLPLQVTISLLCLGVCFIGGYRLRHRLNLVNFYILLYLLVFLAWPQVWRSQRFMIPLAPVLSIYFVSGIKELLEFFEVRHFAIPLVCVAVMTTNLFALEQYATRQRGYTQGWQNYLKCATWARDNTEPDALILCRKPFLFYIFSNRKTLSYPFTTDLNKSVAFLRKWKPRYVVIEKFREGVTSSADVYLRPLLYEMLDSIEVAYQTGSPVNAVIRINKLP